MIAPWDGDRINLKIATWNLARVLPKDTARTAKIVGWLDRIDADVWVLTETHNSVSPGPGYSAASTGYPDRPGEPGERWATIWSRLPIEPLRWSSTGPSCHGSAARAGTSRRTMAWRSGRPSQRNSPIGSISSASSRTAF